MGIVARLNFGTNRVYTKWRIHLRHASAHGNLKRAEDTMQVNDQQCVPLSKERSPQLELVTTTKLVLPTKR